jgi:hypothetical protein
MVARSVKVLFRSAFREELERQKVSQTVRHRLCQGSIEAVRFP